MTPREQGRRAAARENEPDISNPYDAGTAEADEFANGVIDVLGHRNDGRDPGGHQPPPPHLCVSDPSKVCNCCERCAAPCAAEAAAKRAASAPVGTSRDRWVLPRIAYALEQIVLSNSKGDYRTCQHCECRLVFAGFNPGHPINMPLPPASICPVCGEKQS